MSHQRFWFVCVAVWSLVLFPGFIVCYLAFGEEKKDEKGRGKKKGETTGCMLGVLGCYSDLALSSDSLLPHSNQARFADC